MRLSILAVGRQKRGPEQELFDSYIKRATAQGRSLGITGISLKELPESTAQTVALRKADEAERLLAQIPAKAVVVALDEHGTNPDSVTFSGHIRAWLDAGASDAAFLIGGPDGHGEAALARAQLKLSLGNMTWPHGLARVMLAEQIYRSVTILLNHPYHRV